MRFLLKQALIFYYLSVGALLFLLISLINVNINRQRLIKFSFLKKKSYLCTKLSHH